MKKKTRASVLTITTIGSTHVGGSTNGTFQPPRKSVVVSAETTMMFRYSAAKNAAKRPPPYSVM